MRVVAVTLAVVATVLGLAGIVAVAWHPVANHPLLIAALIIGGVSFALVGIDNRRAR